MNKLEKIDDLISDIRSLQESNREILFPVSFADGVAHQPVNPMHFKVGEWTETPWKGVNCFGIMLTEKVVKVVCEILYPIRLNRQEHGPWSERLVMDTGQLFEHTTGNTYTPGSGEYFQPPGVVHEPEFKIPSICLITWNRS